MKEKILNACDAILDTFKGSKDYLIPCFNYSFLLMKKSTKRKDHSSKTIIQTKK